MWRRRWRVTADLSLLHRRSTPAWHAASAQDLTTPGRGAAPRQRSPISPIANITARGSHTNGRESLKSWGAAICGATMHTGMDNGSECAAPKIGDAGQERNTGSMHGEETFGETRPQLGAAQLKWYLRGRAAQQWRKLACSRGASGEESRRRHRAEAARFWSRSCWSASKLGSEKGWLALQACDSRAAALHSPSWPASVEDGAQKGVA